MEVEHQRAESLQKNENEEKILEAEKKPEMIPIEEKEVNETSEAE